MALSSSGHPKVSRAGTHRNRTTGMQEEAPEEPPGSSWTQGEPLEVGLGVGPDTSAVRRRGHGLAPGRSYSAASTCQVTLPPAGVNQDLRTVASCLPGSPV